MPPLPLQGMKVLDLTRALSGPFCTSILGDLGADVLKIESADGDMSREWGPYDRGVSTYFLSANRNKRSVSINYRSPEGLRLLREMVLKSDVLIENFRPGVMDKIGLNVEALRLEKPGLIVAGISGYGVGGPLGGRAGLDQIAQGHSGFMSLTGTDETGPMRVGVAIGDLISGMWLVIGILASWSRRNGIGQGAHVETSLLSSLVALLSFQGQGYLSTGEVPKPTGNLHALIAPYGVFHTKDGDMSIGVATQNMWFTFCELIGRPDLVNDQRFTTNAERIQHRDELKLIIEVQLGNKTRSEWIDLLVDAQIPAGPIYRLDEVFNDEQVAHLGLIETCEHAQLGNIRQISSPIIFNRNSHKWIRRAPPLLGQHTYEVLLENGYSKSQLDEWTTRGVIFQNDTTAVGTPSDRAKLIMQITALKLRMLTPMIVVFLTVFFGLATVIGFGRPLLGIKIVGSFNLGFALIGLNYLTAWLVTIFYVYFANSRLDPLVQQIKHSPESR